ncbi:MAG TPA: long-chain fatty acid--CoA ligase [Candidatus Bathyarchaeia archaeon]|nr:long-chain fatty acid--CoA ligase [Candidatus Bathyarchaeia archaeon]
MLNVVDEVTRQADRAGGAIALIADGEEISYARLAEMSEAAARELTARGAFDCPSGVARVGLACPDGAAYVVLALAILRAGGCVVPIAAELAPPERDVLVRSVALDGLVLAGERGWHRPLEGARSFTALGTTIGVARLSRQARGGPPAFDEAALAALVPAFVRFSSGTTGASKGVVLSHRSLLERVAAANRGLGIGPADRVAWVLPMAHHFAVSIMLYLVHGATIVLGRSHLAPDVLAAARRHGATVVYGAPFHHALLAAESSGLDWPTLRLAVSTAQALPESTARAFAARFGIALSQALGIIEVGLPAINLDAARDEPASVGRPLPGFEVEIRRESGERAAAGEVGELLIRGPGMLDAYLAPWRPRAAVLDDGWFHSGDLAFVDEAGLLFLAGRVSSVINVGGMKCFPEEIEAVLREHDGVAAARVLARPHPQLGALPIAEVVPRDLTQPPSAEALARHCRASLARYKVPVEFRVVEALPLTSSGKVRR